MASDELENHLEAAIMNAREALRHLPPDLESRDRRLAELLIRNAVNDLDEVAELVDGGGGPGEEAADQGGYPDQGGGQGGGDQGGGQGGAPEAPQAPPRPAGQQQPRPTGGAPAGQPGPGGPPRPRPGGGRPPRVRQ